MSLHFRTRNLRPKSICVLVLYALHRCVDAVICEFRAPTGEFYNLTPIQDMGTLETQAPGGLTYLVRVCGNIAQSDPLLADHCTEGYPVYEWTTPQCLNVADSYGVVGATSFSVLGGLLFASQNCCCVD